MKLTLLLLEIRSGLPGFSGHYSEGLASIAAVVKAAGHQFELIHLTHAMGAERLAAHVARSAPDLVGISCMSHTFPYVQRYAHGIKSALPRVPLILGGVHAILNPEESIAVAKLDMVCLGEGEPIIVQILECLEQGRSYIELPGIWVKHGDRVRRNPPIPLVENLDSLPCPDRSIFDFSRLVSTREGVLYMLASRGCPYPCAFCCNEAIRNRFPNRNKYLRYKSVSRICQEIADTVDSFPGKLRGIYFQDEILTLNTRWLAEFAEVYPRRIGVPFNCNLRADLVRPETVKLLRQAGCNSVSIGLESGVQRIREVVVGKRITDAEIHAAFCLLSESGIGVHTFSMVGLPGETPEDALSTVFMNSAAPVQKAMVSIFCPYPGTRLYDRCLAEGTLSKVLPDTYQESSPLVQASISARQVEFIHDYFGTLVYLRRWRWAGPALERFALAFVKHDGLSLKILSSLKRGIRRALALPYLYFFRYLVNRQSRVFGGTGAGNKTRERAASVTFPRATD